jgi:CheY-like chemotaxis protein
MRNRNLFRALSVNWKGASPECPAHEVPQSKAFPKCTKFVLVDDLPDVLNCIEACLQRGFSNVRILKFTDGEEAWAEVVREEPDYLISDLMRPGVNGYELLRRLAQRGVKFPVLIVSTALFCGKEKARQSAGPELKVSFLPKPFDCAEFISIVDRDLSIGGDAQAKAAAQSRPAARGHHHGPG